MMIDEHYYTKFGVRNMEAAEILARNLLALVSELSHLLTLYTRYLMGKVLGKRLPMFPRDTDPDLRHLSIFPKNLVQRDLGS
jgi:hypothetical protein